MTQENIHVVLVHGAWADGSSWRDVMAPLRAAGASVVAAPLPLTSLHDDVAALAPDEGEVVADVFYRGEPHPLAPKLAPDAHGLIWLPHEAFGAAFAQNASPATREWLAAVQRPIAVPCISTPVGRPRWKDVPAWYLLAEDDRMIRRETQAFMAGRMQATIVARPVDHAPGVTAPDVVVDIVLAAIDATKGD